MSKYCRNRCRGKTHSNSIVERLELIELSFDVKYCAKTMESENASRDTTARNHCHTCCQSFPTKSKFLQHIRSHASSKKCICEVCKRTFRNASNLRMHSKIHSIKNLPLEEKMPNEGPMGTAAKSVRTFECYICCKTYMQRQRLVKHLRCHSVINHICDVCNRTFKSRINLTMHSRIHVKIAANDTDGKEDSLKEIFSEEAKPVVGDLVEVLEYDKQPIEPAVNDLASTDVTQKAKERKCLICSKVFSSSSALATHASVHSKERPVECFDCHKTFKQIGSLKVHQRIHSGEKMSCNICSKTFTQSANLKTHLRIHSNEKSFGCSICSKSFNRFDVLATHQLSHSGEKPFSCSDCGKSFTQLTSLKSHHRIHSGSKPFTCSICGMRFTQSGSLLVHRRVHTKETPFQCETCGKSFTQLASLNYHILSHNADNRKFACNYEHCKMAFVRRDYLKSHVRTHTKERPFGCHCGKRFSRSSILTKHKKTHLDDAQRNTS